MSASVVAAGPVFLQTRSGSEYVVDGDTVHRMAADAPPATYRLVDLGEEHLRYTDGHWIYVSSVVVSRLAA